eukprot:3875182-Amphidinium_carterae.1
MEKLARFGGGAVLGNCRLLKERCKRCPGSNLGCSIKCVLACYRVQSADGSLQGFGCQLCCQVQHNGQEFLLVSQPWQVDNCNCNCSRNHPDSHYNADKKNDGSFKKWLITCGFEVVTCVQLQ